MAEYLDNPAGRLLALFQKARFVQTSSSVLNVWALVFDIKLEGQAAEFELLHRLFETYELLEKLVDEISHIEDPEEREEFMVPIPRLRNAIIIGNGANTNSAILSGIRDGDLIVLKFCSRYLHNHQPEPVADPLQLERLTAKLNELFDVVQASSTLEAELKTFLLSRIEEIRRGIQEYRIGGIERLRETLGTVYGSAFVHSDTIQEAKDTDELRQFGAVVNQLAAIVTFAWKTTKMLESVQTIFPMLLK